MRRRRIGNAIRDLLHFPIMFIRVELLVDCCNLLLGVKGTILNMEGLLYSGVVEDTQNEMEYI